MISPSLYTHPQQSFSMRPFSTFGIINCCNIYSHNTCEPLGVFDFLLEIDKAKRIQRQTYCSDGETLENDAEHGWHAALGNWHIINKKILTDPGPFGTRWMGLNKPGYGIHGTNAVQPRLRDLL